MVESDSKHMKTQEKQLLTVKRKTFTWFLVQFQENAVDMSLLEQTVAVRLFAITTNQNLPNFFILG